MKNDAQTGQKRWLIIRIVENAGRRLWRVLTGSGKADDTLPARFLQSYERDRLVVFDTETTGLDRRRDDIVQIAALEILDGEPGREFEVYLDTDRDLSATEPIHHISKAYLADHATDREEALRGFLDFVGESPLVAHNLDYDWEILHHNLARAGLSNPLRKERAFDSIALARRLYPHCASYRLESLLETLGVEGVNSHNALDDVRATANLLRHLSIRIREDPSLSERIPSGGKNNERSLQE